MHLKKLEILGFKSFGEKVILNFEPGITAIVGPNGCGKSNVFDSIRWVLGEQSVKEMRGSSMGDFIFNGTDKRPALGFAEVSLTFSNEFRMLPIEYNEVTVTRRLFRSGESEYLLNKTVVRLKDILELFMGTGIGAESYSLIQQGKVDLIVNSKPEERRMIIDEAAGITKYKSKKREALNKLKDTENNLLRINDIILEVKRQIASLERQANKARKYKEEFEKLKDLEIMVSRYQLQSFSEQNAQIQELLETHGVKESELRSELENVTNLLSQELNLSGELEHKINGVHADDIKLENQIAMNSKQIDFNEERIAAIEQQKERFCEQRAQLEERCRSQEEKIQSLKDLLSSLEEALKIDMQSLDENKNQLSSVIYAIKDAKHTIREDEEIILELTTRQVNIKNKSTEVMKQFQGCLARKRRLEVEVSKVTSEKEEVDNRLRSVCEDIDGCSGKIDDLKDQQEKNIEQVDTIKKQSSDLERTIDDLEKKRLFLRSQKEFIDKLRVQYDDIPDPVIEGTLLTTMPPTGNDKGIIGKVKEVRYAEGIRSSVIKNNFAQFANSDIYEVICETKFIELDPQLISVKIEELTVAIELHLQKRQILVSDIKIKENEILNLTHSIHDLEKVLSSHETLKNEILEKSSKLLGELDIISEELSEAKDAIVRLKSEEEEVQQKQDAINQEIETRRNDIRQQQDNISIKTQEREEVSVAIAQLETEFELANEREKNQLENLNLFEETLASAREEIERLEKDYSENQIKKQGFDQGIETFRSKNSEIELKRVSLKDVLCGYEQQKTEVSNRAQDVRNSIQSIEEKIEQVKSNIHNEQLKDQELSFSEKSIKDRLLQSYKINFDELVFEDSIGEINIEEASQDINRLTKRCESFGSVNLVAIEEFDALKERFEFLTKQQSDLITARESLHSTINKINRTTRQLFLDTFTKVSEEFRIYFRMLFGGGEAQLILIDPENVLETGIDIIARPPGKKLQNIALLSGGEKSLAAIALIFGVFKVKPSPFCILDEIDAALDESNVGRFSYLLKDFAKIAQFIVITHNKKTIVSANVMYGITMQETGISKAVSVKFADEESHEEKEEEVPVGV